MPMTMFGFRRALGSLGAGVLVFGAAFGLSVHAYGEEITIATGGPTGVYYPTGVAICKSVNKLTDEHGITCKAVTSGGSVDNIERLRAGTADFAIVQSDTQYFAVKGYGPFKKVGPDQHLRAVISFFPESFTVIARKDAHIVSLNDLKGKRVSIGNVGSGNRTSMDLVMHFKNWTKETFGEAWELASEKQREALCDGKIDAFVFVAGHPNDSIKETFQTCDVTVVNTYDADIKKIIGRYPYFGPVRIPGGTYKGMSGSVPTFGVLAGLQTTTRTSDVIVKQVVRSIFEDFIDFRFQHPAFFTLNPEQMVTRKQMAPVHDGAVAYFKQMGYKPRVEHVSPPR